MKTLALLAPKSTIVLTPGSTEDELQLFSEVQQSLTNEHDALRRQQAFIEKLARQMPPFQTSDLKPLDVKNSGERRHDPAIYFFWQELRPTQRARVCRALAHLYICGISNSTAQDLKQALYWNKTLDKNHWNAALVLLSKHEPRTLLQRFNQGSAVLHLDCLKVEWRG